MDSGFSLVGYVSTNDDFLRSTSDIDKDYNEYPTFIAYSKEHQFAKNIMVTNDRTSQAT